MFNSLYKELGFNLTTLSYRDFYMGQSAFVEFSPAVSPILSTDVTTPSFPELDRVLRESFVFRMPSGLVVLVISLMADNELLPKWMAVKNKVAVVTEVITRLRILEGVDVAILLCREGTAAQWTAMARDVKGLTMIISDREVKDFPHGLVRDPTTGSVLAAHASCPNDPCTAGNIVMEASLVVGAGAVPLSCTVTLRTMSGSAPQDPDMLARVSQLRAGVLSKFQVPLVVAARDLEGRREVCRLTECEMGTILADAVASWAGSAASPGSLNGSLPLHAEALRVASVTPPVAMINSGFIRASFSRGNVTVLQMTLAFPFQSNNVLLLLPGRTLMQSLKRSLLDLPSRTATSYFDGGFLQFSEGLRVSYDWNRTLVSRVQVRQADSTWEDISYTKKYLVATLSFTAAGGDNYTFLAAVPPVATSNTSTLDLFTVYMSRRKVVGAGPAPPVSLLLQQGLGRLVVPACPPNMIQPEISNADQLNCQPCPANQIKRSEQACIACNSTYYANTTADVCVPLIVEETRKILLPRGVFGGFIALGSALIAVSVVSAALIHRARALPIVKLSSPIFNYLVILGCILAWVSICISGVETSLVCNVWFWTVALAFTCVFGSLFLKLHRIHRIFHSKTRVMTGLKDSSLLKRMAVLVLFDVVVLLVWSIGFPLRLTVKREYKVDKYIAYTAPVCQGPHASVFGGILGVSKIIMIVWATVLAVRTRNVNLRDMNEARHVAVSVYTILVITSITVPVYAVISGVQSRPAAFVVTNMALALVPFVVLVLIVGTKLFHIYVKKKKTLGEKPAPGPSSSMVVHRGVLERQGSQIVGGGSLVVSSLRQSETVDPATSAEGPVTALLRVRIQELQRQIIRLERDKELTRSNSLQREPPPSVANERANERAVVAPGGAGGGSGGGGVVVAVEAKPPDRPRPPPPPLEHVPLGWEEDEDEVALGGERVLSASTSEDEEEGSEAV